MMEEIWKDIEGYEGIYQVSNIGRVKCVQNHKCLNQYTSKGYKLVSLRKEGVFKSVSVHRLVAKAFCNGYFEGAVVNHKDENPLNNNAENLEWCTRSYNATYNDAQIKGRERACTRDILNHKRWHLGMILRELRKRSGLTTWDSAKKAQISESHIRRIELGIASVSFDTLESVANVYGYTLTLTKKEHQP